MPDPHWTWIDRREDLPAVVAAVAASPWLGLDSEGNSMHAYRERMCLLQLNAGGTLFLIDTLALMGGAETTPSAALAPLAALLADPARTVLLHGGEYDAGTLRRDFGIGLGRVWDSQQAASMLGWPQTGYAAVVEKICGVKLEKAFTHYDWAKRPIDPGALRYAVDDVVHLPAVHEHLTAAIAAADLVEELAIANAAVRDARWSGGFDPGGFWRIKGVRDLGPNAHGVLAALWSWRDAVARELDLPPGRLLNGELLLVLARKTPTSYQQLKHCGVHGRLLASHGDALIEVIRSARTAPPDLPPRAHHREVEPAEEDRERRLKDWRRSEAERRQVPLQAVLPAKALEHLKRHGAEDLTAVPQLGAKRIGLYGDKLQALCRAAK